MTTLTCTTGTIKHADPAILQRIKDGFDTIGLFENMLPLPPRPAFKSRDEADEWLLDQWNTLHDVRATARGQKVDFAGSNELTIDICTIPVFPDPFFDHLVSLGCDVRVETSTDAWGCEMFHDIYENGKYTNLLRPEPGELPLGRMEGVEPIAADVPEHASGSP